MATFVKLTRPDGKATYVCPDQVCIVDYATANAVPSGANTTVITMSGVRYVTEDLPTVIALLRNPDAKA